MNAISTFAPAPLALLPAPATLCTIVPFGGFYGGIYDSEIDREHVQTVENWQEDREAFEREFPHLACLSNEEIDWDAISSTLWDVTDHSCIYRDLTQDYASAFATWLAESLGGDWFARINASYRFDVMISPREYNFESDRLFAFLPLSAYQEVFSRLMASAEGQALLHAAIIERHSSRSGFISFYSNEPAAWLAKPLADWDENELCTLLAAWIASEGVEDINYELYENSLYEAVYTAFSNAVDWEKLATRVTEDHLEIAAEYDERAAHALANLPYRCPSTLPLPFAGATLN